MWLASTLSGGILEKLGFRGHIGCGRGLGADRDGTLLWSGDSSRGLGRTHRGSADGGLFC